MKSFWKCEWTYPPICRCCESNGAIGLGFIPANLGGSPHHCIKWVSHSVYIWCGAHTISSVPIPANLGFSAPTIASSGSNTNIHQVSPTYIKWVPPNKPWTGPTLNISCGAHIIRANYMWGAHPQASRKPHLMYVGVAPTSICLMWGPQKYVKWLIPVKFRVGPYEYIYQVGPIPTHIIWAHLTVLKCWPS